MYTKRATRVLALVPFLVLSAACRADTPGPHDTEAPSGTAPAESGRAGGEGTSTVPDPTDRPLGSLPEPVPPQEVPPGTVTGEVPEDLLAPVVEDAADRAGVDSDAIEVITGQAMLWADGSLGCAEPDQVYTAAQVPGYWVVVEAGGAAFDYRLDDHGFFKLCTSPLPAPGESSPSS